MTTTLVIEENLDEKARGASHGALWTDVTSRTTTLTTTTLPTTTRPTTTLTTTLDEQYLATTLARVLDEFVDDVLEGIDEASTDTTHAIARCADGQGTLTHLFFSDDEFDIARAKAICSRCRLAPTCLEGALERGEAYGVWGGELLIEGVIVAVKRGRGRPPKTPRPVLIVDEVPVPPHLVA